MTNQFTQIVMDIMLQCIPNRIFKCDDKDPPWIAPEIKTTVKHKHQVYNKYVKRGRKPEEWEHVRSVRNDISAMIMAAKQN